MAALDGNAIAGRLAALVGGEVTTARIRCAGCGAVDVVADVALVLTPMGAVARCRHCDAVLITLVDDGERDWLGLPGASALGVARR